MQHQIQANKTDANLYTPNVKWEDERKRGRKETRKRGRKEVREERK
jgi:hypothetical protein